MEPIHGVLTLGAQPNISSIVYDSISYCLPRKYQFSKRQYYRLHLMNKHKMKLD
jgi:hypothetical protein